MARRALGLDSLAVVQAVRRELDAGGVLPIRVGVSGGADSMALAAGLAHWVARRPELTVQVVVVDHGLQPGSAEIADAVAERVRALGVPARVVRVEVGSQGGPEAAARDARYAALRAPASDEIRARLCCCSAQATAQACADSASEVWLGHTRDDQAETVLLGLARGSGTRSIAGMAARQGDIVRPLLGLRRATTEAACQQWGIEVWSDPHNADPRFLRSALRQRAMPELVGVLGDGVVDALARTADLARADADLLDQLALEAASAVLVGDELDADALATQPEALRTRIVRDWLRDLGCDDLTQRHVQAVLALVTDWHGQGAVQVPGGLVVARSGRRLAPMGDVSASGRLR